MELFALNNRLANVEYISGVADEKFHEDLCSSIRDMGGKPIASSFPYSWRRNYELYEDLVRQNGNGTLRVEYKPWVDPVAEYVRDWRAYHSERSQLLYMAERAGLSETDVAPFLKLEIGDLTTQFKMPELRDGGMLPRDWGKAAYRVNEAYREYRPLTDEQFTIRYLCFTVKQLLAALEAAK